MSRTPVQKRSISKKERIVAAAYNLVKLKGYASVGIRDIAEAAEVSIGTLYAYFTDKNDVALEILRMYSEELYGSFAENAIASINEARSHRDIIYAIIVRMKDIIEKNMRLHREFTILALSDERFGQMLNNVETERVTKEVGMLMERFGSILAVQDKEAAIQVVHRSIDEIVCHALFFKSPVAIDRILNETADMIYRYLVKH